MLTEQELSHMFKSLLEKIIFDNKQLNKLKGEIKAFQENKLSIKEFKKILLIEKVSIMENLLDVLPHYAQSIFPFDNSINRKIKEHNDNKRNNSQVKVLKKKIQEREELLEIIGRKLKRICEKRSTLTPKLKEPSKLTGKNFILDGSNIARHNQSSQKGSIQDVIGSKQVLLNAGIREENIFIIFGSGLHHHITDEEKRIYDDLLQKRNNVQAPAGADDDWFIIQHGLKHNAYIITNDLYSEYKEKGENYKDYVESHSIRFSIIGNDVYFEKELEML
jgi:hypothetical protein